MNLIKKIYGVQLKKTKYEGLHYCDWRTGPSLKCNVEPCCESCIFSNDCKINKKFSQAHQERFLQWYFTSVGNRDAF